MLYYIIMTISKNDNLYNIILSLFLGIMSVIVINQLFTQPRNCIIYKKNI